MEKKFHAFRISVTSNEDTDDFQFIFESLKESCDELFGQKYEPEVLIADCADAITNAATLAFGDMTCVHCWAHVVRNIDKNLVKIKSRSTRVSIRLDIFQLQLAKSEEEFITASSLWVKKWLAVEGAKDFVDYFNSEYIVKYSGWYEGIAPNSPSSNNCLESTNNVLKNECTLRQRLPIREFILQIFEKLGTWSKLVDPESPNHKPYSLAPDLPLKLQADSYYWARINVSIKRRVKSGTTYY